VHRCVAIDEVLHSGRKVVARGVTRNGWLLKFHHQVLARYDKRGLPTAARESLNEGYACWVGLLECESNRVSTLIKLIRVP